MSSNRGLDVEALRARLAEAERELREAPEAELRGAALLAKGLGGRLASRELMRRRHGRRA